MTVYHNGLKTQKHRVPVSLTTAEGSDRPHGSNTLFNNLSFPPAFQQEQRKGLTRMHADTALSTADQAAGSIVCYVRVRQLSLHAVTHLAGLGVEAHFRDEGFRPLLVP